MPSHSLQKDKLSWILREWDEMLQYTRCSLRRKFAGYACANFVPNGNASAMSAREAWAMPVPVLVLVEALERARRNFFFPLMGLFWGLTCMRIDTISDYRGKTWLETHNGEKYLKITKVLSMTPWKLHAEDNKNDYIIIKLMSNLIRFAS